MKFFSGVQREFQTEPDSESRTDRIICHYHQLTPKNKQANQQTAELSNFVKLQ